MSLPIPQPATLMQYAKARFQCACGHEHATDIQKIMAGPQAVREMAGLLASQTGRSGRRLDPQQDEILIITDENAWQAAGTAVEAALAPLAFKVRRHVFPGQPTLVPDEKAIFDALNALTPATGLLIAVGSGTLNDTTRFVSFKTGLPYYIVATAPSMDGYASSVSALIHNNLKITYDVWGAAAIIADPALLGTCPAVMLAAGLGDILGKYSAICDWRLSAIVEQEYYCPDIADLVLQTAGTALANAPALAERSPAAVQQIMDGLLMTGITMSYAGNSRPASGAEHHLSHFWEMAFQRLGRPAVLHGSKVGLGEIVISRLYQHLLNLEPDFAAARAGLARCDFAAWSSDIRRVYQDSADEVIALEKKSGKNDPRHIAARIDALEANWPRLMAIVRQTMPDPAAIRTALRLAGGAVTPAGLGIEGALVDNAVRFAKELRNRYTVLQLYADLGLTEEAVRITRELFAE